MEKTLNGIEPVPSLTYARKVHFMGQEEPPAEYHLTQRDMFHFSILAAHNENKRNLIKTRTPTPTEFSDYRTKDFGSYQMSLEESAHLSTLVVSGDARDKKELISTFAGQLLALNEKRQNGEYQ